MADLIKTIQVSEDTYSAIQEIKQVFKELSWESVEKDEDVINILINGFLESLDEMWDEEDMDDELEEDDVEENSTDSSNNGN